MRIRLGRDYLSYGSVILLLVIVLMAPVQVYLGLSLYGVYPFQSFLHGTVSFRSLMGLNLIISLVPVGTSIMFLMVLMNVYNGVSRDIERGYLTLHLSLSASRKSLLAAELVSTSVVPYTLFFVSICLSASATGFQENFLGILGAYLFDFLPVLLFFSAMMLMVAYTQDRSQMLLSGIVSILTLSSLIYLVPKMYIYSPFFTIVLIIMGSIVPGYLAGVFYYSVLGKFPLNILPGSISSSGDSKILTPTPVSYPFINFGSVVLITCLNIVINVALLILLFRFWSEKWEGLS